MATATLASCLTHAAWAADPVAEDDNYTTPAGQQILADVSDNDSGLDGPNDVFDVVSPAAHGSVNMDAAGSFSYQPNTGFSGSDSFTYRIDDNAGGVDTANVYITVNTASDFITVNNPDITALEDEDIPLGMSVDPGLYDGGALLDIKESQIGFRPSNAGTTPTTFTIPNGVLGAAITGFSTRNAPSPSSDAYNDDYQLINVQVDLSRGFSSGRVAYLYHGRIQFLDQYSWKDVPLGDPILDHPTLITGNWTGDINPTISVSGNQLSIVENHGLETAYQVEFMASSENSTNFIGAGTEVQNVNIASSTFPIDSSLEPGDGNDGLIVINENAAATGSNSSVEYKGFGRFVIDLESRLVSGAIAAEIGETGSRTVTYAFHDYPLIDLRDTPGAAPLSILSNSGTILGDTTATSTVRSDPTIYINASGELVMERSTDYANTFTSLFTAENYQRTGYVSIASFVSFGDDDSLFDSRPADNVDNDGKVINEWRFNIPGSAAVGLVRMSWNTIGGSQTNENVGFGYAVVDLANSTSSGSITFIRTSTPDLLAWDQVPIGETFFGATDGSGNPLYSSNKSAGSFTDQYPETATFNVVSNPDGSRELVFTATDDGGTQNYRDYRGNALVGWFGNEPFEIEGFNPDGTLSHGAPNDDGNWEIDFADIPNLSYLPPAHYSGVTELNFSLSSTGENDVIRLHVQPVADAPTLTANNAGGYAGQALPLDITLADSPDDDGSETQPQLLYLSDVPSDVTLSASAGSVTSLGGGSWSVTRNALASLEANSNVVVPVTTVQVSTTVIDEFDLDDDGTIEDGDNGDSRDEYDELTETDSFDINFNSIPTVISQYVNSGTPTITGTANVLTGETFTVTVDGVTYTAGDGNLSLSGNNWSLSIPAANEIAEGSYDVTANLTNAAGSNSSDDQTSGELVVDQTPPPAPGVTSQITNDTTPLIEGTTINDTSVTLSVTVNGSTYVEGDGNLQRLNDGTWLLEIPAGSELAEGTYQVVATHTDAAGNTSNDPGVDDLVIDLTPPNAPGVTSLSTNSGTPTIEGTATINAGDTLTVTVNGVTYTEGDGNLVDNGDDTWSLTIPGSDSLAEATYDVTATLTDNVGNSADDPSSQELDVDFTAPVPPSVDSQLSNSSTPVITGSASTVPGDTLEVSIAGTTYVAGDGHLTDNGDGTWSLQIPGSDALAEGLHDVTVVITDAAGNSSSDTTTDEIEIDLTPPPVPTVDSQITNNTTPTLTGNADTNGGNVLTVTVDSVTYTAGDGDLTDNGDGTWTLQIPAANELAEDTYSVVAELTDPAGNSASDTTDSELQVDLTPPPAPGVTSQTTNSGTPTIEGTTVIGNAATLSVTVNGVTYTEGDGNLTDNGDGTWSLVIPASDTLPENLYQVVATHTDAAGNTSTDPGVDDLLVDTTAPPAPGVTSLTTNDTTPVVEGTADVMAGDTLTVTINSVTYTAGDGNLTDNGDGTWSLQIPTGDTLAEGGYDVTATLTDSAGNATDDPSSQELLIDTTAPVAPTVDTLLTNSNTPTLTGTATLASGEVLEVSVDGQTYSSNDAELSVDASGNWSLNIPAGNPIAEGVYDILASITDAAGNGSQDSTTDELTIDNTPPVEPTVNSQITNNDTPTITGTAETSSGNTLSVTVNGVTYTTGDGNLVDNGDDTWTLTIPAGDALPENSYEVVATLTDAAGNAIDDSTSDELIIDLTPPPAPGVTSQTTMDTTPLIEGTTVNGSGVSLQVTVDGVTYTTGDGNLVDNGDGTWSLQIPAANAMPEGTYQVVAVHTDAAGNTASDPSVDELVVDLTAPPSPGVTSQVTNDTTPLIEGTATTTAGDTLAVEVNGVTYTAGDGNLTDNGDGTWNLQVPSSNAIPEGNYDVTATVTDSAGNQSVDPSSNELVVDLTAPAAPTVDAQLTNNDTPTITGTASLAPGESLTVLVNGITYAESDPELTLNPDGSWELTLTDPDALAEGIYDVVATIEDAAGNTSSNSDTGNLEVDLTAPPQPTVDNLITNDQTPQLTGTATVESGDTLTVEVDGVVYTDGDGQLNYTPPGGAGAGSWTLDIPPGNALNEGVYDVLATVEDAAGNTSADASNNELEVDLTPPPAPGVTSQTTNDPTPTIEGTTVNATDVTLEVTVNGVTYTPGDGNLTNNGDGTWTLEIPASDALSDGTYQVVATHSDAAGNTTTDSGTDDLVVDSVAPSTPGVTSLITNDTTPVIEGTATIATGETLTVTVNGTTYTAGDGNLVDNGDDTWALTIPAANAMAEGVYDVTATVTDAASNTSTDPSSNELTIDLTAPTAPTVDAQLSNSGTPTVTGTANPLPGETLTVTVNGITYSETSGEITIDSNGDWSLPIPASDALADGVYEVTAVLTDQAGNTTTDTQSGELEIDLTPPAAPTVNALLTNSTTPTITGTATLAAGETLVVTIDGNSYDTASGQLTVNPDGSWSLDIPATSPLSHGTYDVTATTTDAAGNSTSDTTTDEIEVDLFGPPAPLVDSQTTNDNTPTITGSASLGPTDSLSVSVDGQSFTLADPELVDNGDGTWTLNVPSSIADGVYDVTATATDAAGNASPDTSNNELTIDTVAPETPTVVAQTSGSATPTLTGTATLQPGETLEVTVNGVTYTEGDGNLSVDASGNWTLNIPNTDSLGDGTYPVTATIIDSAGNATTDASVDELIVDLTAPEVPVVNTLLSNSQTPSITGTATPQAGETLTVTVNGVTYTEGDGNLSIAPDGSWTLVIPASDPLPEGAHEVVATLTDTAGNTSSDNSSDEVTIDLTPPPAPGVTSQSTSDTTPLISGSVSNASDTTLAVTVNGITYTEGDGQLQRPGDSTWTLQIPTSDTLSDALYDVDAMLTDAAGNSSIDPSDSELLVDTEAPTSPGVTSQSTSDTTPVISGTATLNAGATLTVTVNGVTYSAGDGHLVDHGDGTWSLSIPSSDTLPESSFDVTATVTDSAGNATSDPSSSELLIDITAPTAPTVDTLASDSGTPTLGGTATLAPGENLSVVVNGVTYSVGDGHLSIDSNGNWTLTLPNEDRLDDGVYDVVATITDSAGNTASDSSTDELLIDTAAPAQPTVDSLVTNDTTPTLSGTANLVAGESLTVSVNGRSYNQSNGLVIDSNGNWQITLPNADQLEEGTYSILAFTTDTAGNTAYDSTSQELIVDTTAPSLSNTTPGEVTSYRPGLGGSSNAPNGTVVTIRDSDGNIVCEGVVHNGFWACTPQIALPEGLNHFTATITDPVGNARDIDITVDVSRDFDGDGLPNTDEGNGDSDGDGVLDRDDLDSDNDGIPDRREGRRDSDDDGVPDYLDGDSDNDGLPDLVEANGEDTNNNYRVDNFVDQNANGLDDLLELTPLESVDTDNDLVPDYLDVDSDNDGITDLLESAGSDIDGDGRIDQFRDTDQNGIDDGVEAVATLPIDTDNDGIFDHRDLDSDNDELLDVVEAGNEDADEDGLVDSLRDDDQDGIPDSVDPDYTYGADSNGNGIDDAADAALHGYPDEDGDGIGDTFDADADGDGYADAVLGFSAALPDVDGNGVPDFQQNNNGTLVTGVRGHGGCSLLPPGSAVANGQRTVDPTLLLLMLAALGLYRRRSIRFTRLAVNRTHFGASNAVAIAAVFSLYAMQPQAVQAQSLEPAPYSRGFYLGAGLGLSRLSPDDSESTLTVDDKQSVGGQLSLGYDFRRRLGAELQYARLGEAGLDNGQAVSYELLSLSLLGYLRKQGNSCERGRRINPFARFGASNMSNHSDADYRRANDFSFMFGGGLEICTSNRLAWRAELTSYDYDANFLSLAAVYRWHRQPNAKPTPVASDVAAVMPPVLAEAPTPNAAKLHAQRALYFGPMRTQLTTRHRALLKHVAASLHDNKAAYAVLHASNDPTGSDALNEKLSAQRMAAIRRELVNQGIADTRLQLIWIGQTTELGDWKTASGLDANRRVKIDVLSETPDR